MSYPSAIFHENGVVAFERGTVLTSFAERARGLIGKRSIEPDKAWVFPRCRSVHTWLMRVPIDVACLDRRGRVISVCTLPPWRLPHSTLGATAIIETGAGQAAAHGIVEGATLAWKEPEFV